MNVRLGYPVPLWENLVRTILFDMRRMTRRGFAVNFLATPPPDAPPKGLPRARDVVTFCQEELGCSVDIRDDYGMSEYTMLARCR